METRTRLKHGASHVLAASTSDTIVSKLCAVSNVLCFRYVSDLHIKRAG